MANKNSVVFIVQLLDSFILGASNKEGTFFYNKLHFPGGKIEDGETKEDALKRECLEELSLTVVHYKHLGESYTIKNTHLDWFLIDDFIGYPKAGSDLGFLTLMNSKEILEDTEIVNRLPEFIINFLEHTDE